MQSKDRGWVVLSLFFCSGATALVYEVVWAKYLSQMFGSTIYAQTVVLAAYMGGLALGNRIFGRWADWLRQPVRAYGYLEISIGVYAFFFPVFDRGADWLFVTAGKNIAEHARLLLALKGVLSVALISGPTVLMGGTLPLLAAWLQKSSTDAGRRSARFYSVNSLGAVVGAALAGFWLVEQFGMVAAIELTAFLNVIVGAAAVLLSGSGWLEQPHRAAPEPATELVTASPETLRWVGAVVAVTGAVSMGLEVLASRSLVLVFGSSLQSFAVVLMAFILGIGLGSAWIASPRRQGAASERLVVLLLCAAAAWVTLIVFNFERCVDFYRIARLGLTRTTTGYVYHQLLTAGISLVVLGAPAACTGAVLPLMIRTVSHGSAPLGVKVGALLTWNTLGAVAGALLTGFVLMPLTGLRNAFGALALVLAVVALTAAWRHGWRAGKVGSVAVCSFVCCLFFFGDEGWRHVMSSGVFRMRETEFRPMAMARRKQHFKILFYEDAPDASVTVDQGDGVDAPADIGLRINGKPDASTSQDISTQLLAAHLPMLVKPGAKEVFVLGLGSGVTAGALLSYPVERVVVAENCEPVVRAARFFEKWNHHVLDDPRTRLWHEDARTVLKLRPELYDVIITEPSNPWTVGVGSVFSREYYELAASRLKPGGLMLQWFHTYEVSDEIVGLVLRTFGSVFSYIEIWDTCDGDFAILGSLQPWRTGPEVFRQGFAFEPVRSDLASIGIHSPEALLARQLASQRTGFAIAGGGPIQSDLFPTLEYAAPRAFYLCAQSLLLNLYDERTQQELLAPTDKRATLRALPARDVASVFGTLMIGSVNEELLGCLFDTNASASVPCLFKTNSPLVAIPAVPEDDIPIAATLNKAAALLGGAVEQRRESVVLVESALRSMRPPVNWPAAQWAVLAASVALDLGDVKRAGQLAAFALKLEPAYAQAGYVSRVIDRERQRRQTGGGGDGIIGPNQ